MHIFKNKYKYNIKSLKKQCQARGYSNRNGFRQTRHFKKAMEKKYLGTEEGVTRLQVDQSNVILKE